MVHLASKRSQSSVKMDSMHTYIMKCDKVPNRDKYEVLQHRENGTLILLHEH